MQMKVPPDIPVFGDMSFRGDCSTETLEQVTFFARIRRKYPDTWGVLAIHPRNEGQRSVFQTAHQKAEGLTEGASDIVIPGSPTFVCELKRRDHTKSVLSDEQVKYLRAAIKVGSFACVALGVDAAEEAFDLFRLGRDGTAKPNVVQGFGGGRPSGDDAAGDPVMGASGAVQQRVRGPRSPKGTKKRGSRKIA
jgi:hypothetical protein